MEQEKQTPDLKNFFNSAAELLLKFSASISQECQTELNKTFSIAPDLDRFDYEYIAFLGAIIFHEAHSKNRQEAPKDINQTYKSLQDSITRVDSGDSGHSKKAAALFDDEAFHNLIACYFNGGLEGFQFSQEEIQATSKQYGLEIPDRPGIGAMFFGLLVRLFRVTNIAKLNDETEHLKAAGRIIQITETGISTFGLELQKLT